MISRPQLKPLLLGFSLCLLVSTSQALGAEAPIHTQTKPTQVTVYPNGARIVREGSVELEEGPHAVLFTDLPASTSESSLRVSVEGPKGTRYFGVSFKKQFTDKVVDARTRKLKDRIQILQDQRTDLTDKIEARRAEINLLRSYGTIHPKKGHPATDIHSFAESASVISKKIATLLSENRKQERVIREIDLKISALNNELAQGSSGAREKRIAQADVDLKQAGRVRFKLTYQVAGASWAPVYDLNLDSKGEKPVFELGFNGNIRQNTGEDWKGVTLTLSTLRPNEQTQAPDPTNWWLNYYTTQIEIYRRNRGLPSSPSAAVRDRSAAEKMMKGRSEELEPAELEVAKTIQAEYSVNFSITVPKDIPSDGSDHRVGVLQSQYPAEILQVVVPRLSLSAFIEAKVSYGGDQILLPGPAQLFHDGDFIGNTNLTGKAPGETFELGFGQDDLIRTERKKGDVQSSKGDRRIQWITTVANYHAGNRTIEVREQLPRTQQKDIKVQTLDLNPSPLAENPDKPGLMIWKLDLKPKEKATIHFGYRVTYPETVNLSGLE